MIWPPTVLLPRTLLDMSTGVTEGGLNVTLIIHLLMHGKEVGSIIRKKRESVRKTEENSAQVSISEGNYRERIIILAGPTNTIFKAFLRPSAN